VPADRGATDGLVELRDDQVPIRRPDEQRCRTTRVEPHQCPDLLPTLGTRELGDLHGAISEAAVLQLSGLSTQG
jgi:hypothetical protein